MKEGTEIIITDVRDGDLERIKGKVIKIEVTPHWQNKDLNCVYIYLDTGYRIYFQSPTCDGCLSKQVANRLEGEKQ